ARVASRPLALAGTASGLDVERAVGPERLVLRDRRRRTPAAVRPPGPAEGDRLARGRARDGDRAHRAVARAGRTAPRGAARRACVHAAARHPAVLMEQYGIPAEQAGDGSPVVVWLLREKKARHARIRQATGCRSVPTC